MKIITYISEEPEMLKLYARENRTPAYRVSAREGIQKYLFRIDGHLVYTTPRTVFDHLKEDRAFWNFKKLGQVYRLADDVYESQADFVEQSGIPQQSVSRFMAQGYSYEDIEEEKHVNQPGH